MSVVDVHGVLSSTHPFRRLPESDRHALTDGAVVHDIDRSDQLFRQGESAISAFLLHRGQLRLSKASSNGEQSIVSFVIPGDLFAVVAAMKDTTYPVTADAAVPSVVIAWNRGLLHEVLQQHPELSFEVLQILSARMRELQERFRELASLPVAQRLARALLRLESRCGRPTDEGSRLDLRLTRQDLAELTGTTLFSVSRLLSAWAEEGLVVAKRELVVIADVDRLRRLGDGESPPEQTG